MSIQPALRADRPLLMGILNVTPDSFSDGGRFSHWEQAVESGLRMVRDGADLIDVGGESTRPGSESVDVEEELRRTESVVRGLAREGVCVSIDTCKAEVARAALGAGAAIVNDITALRDPEMRRLCAASDCTVCLMHMKGAPKTMQENPEYADVVGEVLESLLTSARAAEEAGVASNRIWIDPGIGFGKTVDHNLRLLRHLDRFCATDYPVLIGVSRKGFIGRIGGSLPVEDRLPGTLATQVLAQAAGAKIVRAHDVREARQAIDMAAAILATG